MSKVKSQVLMSQISVSDSKEEDKDDDSGESKDSVQNDNITIINDYFLTEEQKQSNSIFSDESI